MVSWNLIYEVLLLVEVGVVLLADICFAVLFLKTPKLREGPGQLILAQTQAQIIVDLHWLLMILPRNETIACSVLAAVGYVGFNASCIYTSAICVAVSVHFNAEKYPSMWRYHAVVLILSVCFFSPILIQTSSNQSIAAFDFCTGSLSSRNWTK